MRRSTSNSQPIDHYASNGQIATPATSPIRKRKQSLITAQSMNQVQSSPLKYMPALPPGILRSKSSSRKSVRPMQYEKFSEATKQEITHWANTMKLTPSELFTLSEDEINRHVQALLEAEEKRPELEHCSSQLTLMKKHIMEEEEKARRLKGGEGTPRPWCEIIANFYVDVENLYKTPLGAPSPGPCPVEEVYDEHQQDWLPDQQVGSCFQPKKYKGQHTLPNQFGSGYGWKQNTCDSQQMEFYEGEDFNRDVWPPDADAAFFERIINERHNPPIQLPCRKREMGEINMEALENLQSFHEQSFQPQPGQASTPTSCPPIDNDANYECNATFQPHVASTPNQTPRAGATYNRSYTDYSMDYTADDLRETSQSITVDETSESTGCVVANSCTYFLPRPKR